jgi:RNA-directed DNA polymerase
MSITFLNSSPEELKEEFYKLRTRQDLALLLQVDTEELVQCLYRTPSAELYRRFDIPKKSGGKRSILAPNEPLKNIQRKLNEVFNSIYQPKPSTHGFVASKSIVTNAEQHLRKSYVLNLDLQDFFPSINFGRVRGLLMAPPYSRPEKVATVLAQLCCYNNQLPQGAPTSPIVSNMICAKMDSQLQRLAQKHYCTYTRYADDITFSTSRSKFPSYLSYFSRNTEKLVIGDELTKIITENGFSINNSKLRLQSKYEHQAVTGITVNEKLNISRKYIRNIRAVLHAWEKYGLKDTANEFWTKYYAPLNLARRDGPIDQDAFKKVIKGRIDFIGTVRGKKDHIYLNFLVWMKRLAPELVSQSSLDFASCKDLNHQEVKAIIWTEGKTDIKHLKRALKWFEKQGFNYRFDLEFKDDLDEKKQGSSELLKVCEQFCKAKHPHPVIAIFDRDEPNLLPKFHDDSRGFKSWNNDVYSFALPTPKHRQDFPDICIELYYQDDEIMRKDVNGRRLFLSREFHEKSGIHHNDSTLHVAASPGKYQTKQLKIIDENVFDSNHNNIALSKSEFAEYIFGDVQNFDNFSFEQFREVFGIIDKILKVHLESQNS